MGGGGSEQCLALSITKVSSPTTTSISMCLSDSLLPVCPSICLSVSRSLFRLLLVALKQRQIIMSIGLSDNIFTVEKSGSITL